MKTCRKCKETKSKDQYTKANWSKDGLNTVCKTCYNLYINTWTSNKKEYVKRKARDNHIKRTYGVTPEEYDTLLTQQKGCCAICGEHHSNLKRTLYVDHNHSTNEIRGLLCQHCNSLLGFSKDNINTIQNALIYLERYLCK